MPTLIQTGELKEYHWGCQAYVRDLCYAKIKKLRSHLCL